MVYAPQSDPDYQIDDTGRGTDPRLTALGGLFIWYWDEELNYVLSSWPGWGGGLNGWMEKKRSPLCNVSIYLALANVSELRHATMLEF